MRNRLVHEEKSVDLMEFMIRSIHRRYSAHMSAWNMQEENTMILWKPPREGVVKINFDVSVKNNWLSAAAV